MKKSIKVLLPIGLSVLGGVVLKGKMSGIQRDSVSRISKDVASSAIKDTETLFGGISESTLDSLAKATSRGVKAVIEGDILKYVYKSNSGRITNTAYFKLDSAGKLIGFLGNGSNFLANSPRFFADKVFPLIRK